VKRVYCHWPSHNSNHTTEYTIFRWGLIGIRLNSIDLAGSVRREYCNMRSSSLPVKFKSIKKKLSSDYDVHKKTQNMFTDINDSDKSIMFILPARPRITSSAFPPDSYMTPAASRRQRAPTSPPAMPNTRLKLSSIRLLTGCESLVLFPLLVKSSRSSSTSSFKLKIRQRLQDPSESSEFLTTSPSPNDKRLNDILLPSEIKADPSPFFPPTKKRPALHVITPLHPAFKFRTCRRECQFRTY